MQGCRIGGVKLIYRGMVMVKRYDVETDLYGMVEFEDGDYVEFTDYESLQRELDAKFVEGAEAFRKMMLEATKAYMWPHIEGVFAVFAKQNNFEPKEIVDELIATKEPQ